MTLTNPTEGHPNPDFTIAGTPLYEWLGNRPDDATITAAKEAVGVPSEPFVVGAFFEPTDPVNRWADGQRRALKLWFKENHPDLPGRLRLNVRSLLEPRTHEDCKLAVVTYDPKPKKKKPADGS
jgi:hypothetical protein